MISSRRSLLTGVLGAAAASATTVAANSGPRRTADANIAGGHALLPLPDTDDTSRLQAEIDRAAADGSPVVLPAGTFRTATLRLPPGTVLLGAHGLTTFE